MSLTTIRDVRVILTAPAGIDLAVVKVETGEPELYGLGCATFTQRYEAVATAVREYLRPLLVGRRVDAIEDTWHLMMNSGYWRNGPVLNNAVSGVDEALWDIKGKQAGMPVYELWGGCCRPAATLYTHAEGATSEEVEEHARALMADGYRYIRCQLGIYGGHMGGAQQQLSTPKAALEGAYYDPGQYTRATLSMFERLRSRLGYEAELLHDVHERLTPAEAIRFACDLEPYRLFFLEDPLAPEDSAWLANLRMHTHTPLAMGELITNPAEWMGLIQGRLIDYLRVHVSQIGGVSPARKLAALCEAYGIRTAWHGPGDLSPVGAAAQLHLDVSCHNFGIQETAQFTEAEREVFPGTPLIENGYMYPNDRPGLGIDIDERAAARYPCRRREHKWLQARRPDGSAARP